MKSVGVGKEMKLTFVLLLNFSLRQLPDPNQTVAGL